MAAGPLARCAACAGRPAFGPEVLRGAMRNTLDMNIDQGCRSRGSPRGKHGPLRAAPPQAPLRRNAWIVRVTLLVVISRSCNAESLRETRPFPLAKVDV